jgi:hypothetical protein
MLAVASIAPVAPLDDTPGIWQSPQQATDSEVEAG